MKIVCNFSKFAISHGHKNSINQVFLFMTSSYCQLKVINVLKRLFTHYYVRKKNIWLNSFMPVLEVLFLEISWLQNEFPGNKILK